MYLFLMFPSWCLRMAVLRVCFITFPGYLHLYQFRCTCIWSSSFLLEASGWLCSVTVALHFLGTFTYISLYDLIFPSGCLRIAVLRDCSTAFPGYLHLYPYRCTCICSSFSVMVAFHWLCTFTYIHLDVHVFGPHLSFWMPQDGCPQ